MPMAWHFSPCERTSYCIEEKRAPSLRGNVLGADTTGPAVASGYKSFNVLDSRVRNRERACDVSS